MVNTIAYIPGYRTEGIDLATVTPRPSNSWRGEAEACRGVTISPRCKNGANIRRAYERRRIPIIEWADSGAELEVIKARPLQTVATGMWAGQDAVIVAGGPSLRGFDFNRLAGFQGKILGINRAYEFLPRIDLFFAMDGPFILKCVKGEFGPDALEKWNALTCPRVCPTLHQREAEFPGVTWWHRGSAKTLPAKLEDGIHTGRNSGFGALHLATMLGAKTIYLLGYDLAPTASGRTEQFHSGYKDNQPDSNYQRFMAAFTTHGKTLSARAQIINCNPGSALKVFPFGSLPDLQKGADE